MSSKRPNPFAGAASEADLPAIWICKHDFPCNVTDGGTKNNSMTCRACGNRGAGFTARSVAAPVGITAAEREQKRGGEKKAREAREAREAEEANKAKK